VPLFPSTISFPKKKKTLFSDEKEDLLSRGGRGGGSYEGKISASGKEIREGGTWGGLGFFWGGGGRGEREKSVLD